MGEPAALAIFLSMALVLALTLRPGLFDGVAPTLAGRVSL